MRSIAVTPSVIQDIMHTEEERLFWEVVRHHERPPFFFDTEGVGNRLNRAARVVTEDRIVPNSDGSYLVTGSEHRQYRVAETCSCPQSQKGKSKYCYHFVAVCLYVEWRKRLRTTVPPLGTQVLASHPDDDETLGNGYPVDDETLPLPLPPTSIDERLAAPAKEVLMTADADPYIPEPDAAPVAVLEAPVPLPAATPLTTALAQWSAQRQVVKEFLRKELHEGTDYYTLQIRGKATKPSLSKAGAEKFLGLLQLQASFAPDLGTWEMLGKPTDQILYVCTLRTRGGEIVGEGRGSRSLKQDGGDVNKALKMSEKSALIDAVLRTGALSEVFTQDAEDMQEERAPATPTSADLRSRIWALVKAADATITTREACEAYVQRVTGMPLVPDNYGGIVAKLEQGR